MEAMILAKPAPTQNDARQPESPINPESKGEDFAPVLDAEVQRSNDNTTETAEDTQTVEATLQSDTESPSLSAPEDESATAAAQAAGLFSLDTILTAVKETAESAENTESPQFATAAIKTTAALSGESTGTTDSLQLQQSETEKLILTQASAGQISAENTSGKENGTSRSTQPSRAETLLIEQIQQLLSKNQNNGPIRIENTGLQSANTPAGTGNNILVGNTGEVQVSQQLASTNIPVETNAGENVKTTTLEGARQDTTNQFLKAKMDKSVTANNDSSQQSASEQQGNSPQKDTMQPAAATASTSVSTSATDGQPIAQFSMLTPATSAAAQPPVEGKLAPGAHLPVQQHEIVDNLIQHFGVNPRLKTGNISIQLHPVELGALKINVLVKDDTISANIIAQSQQIIDTIDKHMPKLRTVLENQGFTIDSFEVTLDSKTDSHHELFQEQFSSQQQGSFTGSNSSGFEDESFETELTGAQVPEMPVSAETKSSGVNVTA